MRCRVRSFPPGAFTAAAVRAAFLFNVVAAAAWATGTSGCGVTPAGLSVPPPDATAVTDVGLDTAAGDTAETDFARGKSDVSVGLWDADGADVACPEGAACDDGDPCTAGDQCRAGACRAGLAVDCDDGDPCTRDECVPGLGCVHQRLSRPGCVAPLPCPEPCDDGDPCTVDVCDTGTGRCRHVAIPACVVCVPAPSGDPVDPVCDDGDDATQDDCVLDPMLAAYVCVHRVDADGSTDHPSRRSRGPRAAPLPR